MLVSKRKPSHPGKILEEHYIKPLNLNLQILADALEISRNTLFRIRMGQMGITPRLALNLAAAFDTTPNLWLNLQQKYDLWIEEHKKKTKTIKPFYRTRFRTSCRKKSVCV